MKQLKSKDTTEPIPADSNLILKELIEARNDILYHYSPYSFLPKQNRKNIINNTVLPILFDESVEPIEIVSSGLRHIFFVKKLIWDTEYFSIPTVKLLTALYTHNDYNVLCNAVKELINIHLNQENIHCIAEIPSEDNLFTQALNENGFKLVESRLTYYLDLNNYSWERYNVRSANFDDIPNLKRVAKEMKNEYDRFHSDKTYSTEKADEFLATYIEESIKGFADYVMVPNEDGIPSDAFLTAKYLAKEWDDIGDKISIMVLSAVSSDTCKGWYLKLISEMAYHLKGIGASYAFMHPATTNRAVIHTYEKLGCKYGKCVNVLTLKK